MKTIKRKLGLAIVFFVILFSVQHNVLLGQSQYLQDANTQLRHIFKHLTYPDNDVLFLYDRSAKVTDETFYSNQSPDTLDKTVWLQLYDEMYYSAHDTTSFIPRDSIELRSYQFYGDTIPIGILDYDFYACKYDAINTGDYFIFDTINNYLYNKPNPIGNPYLLKNVFIAAPLKPVANFLNPVFRIAPDFLFTDTHNEHYYNTALQGISFVRIDFGDNTGWHYFDLTQTTYYQAAYQTKGKHTIKVEIISKKSGDSEPIKKSSSFFDILKEKVPVTPDEVIDMEGMMIGVYKGCETDSKNEKVIIYLEGWDMLDILPGISRGIDQIYDEMISGQTLNELRNFNYTYYVVSWKNSRTDIRFNALHLLNLIEKLKREYKKSEEQFVIIGESMGGLVARYALTFMESEYYQSGDFSPFFQDQFVPQNVIYLANHQYLYSLGNQNRDSKLVKERHKTREFITLDTPHQGANVPLSVQHFYRKAMGLLPGAKLISTYLNFGLEGYAAKQMLIYHIDGKVFPLSHTSSYQPHIAHYLFFRQLASLGDYPMNCKKVALSNGSLLGVNQLNTFGNPRTAGDILLESKSKLYARILFINIPIFGYDFRLKTTPNGTGTFYTAAFGTFTLHIKLKWFGIKIDNSYSNLYNDNQIAVDTKSYDVSAGGYMSAYSVIDNGIEYHPASSYNVSSNWLLNVFGYNLYSDQGCLYLNSHIGWNGVASVNLDFKACTDGTQFGFVPIQSALDYGKGMNIPLNHNILNENINLKLSRTPFDVIIGYPNKFNYGHLDYRDEEIFNITKHPASNCSGDDRYSFFEPDQNLQCGHNRGILTLEIGDEELYLENWTLNRKASFQAQYDLHINERNPYYEYQGYTPQGDFEKKGIYSKRNNFTITNSGFATFYSDYLSSPTGIGLSYTNPQSHFYWNDQTLKQKTCWDYFSFGRPTPEEEKTNSAEKPLNSMIVYPNPNDGSSITVDIKAKINGYSTIEVYSITGQLVYSKEINITTNRIVHEINAPTLDSGLYFIKFSNENYMDTKQLIIH